VDGVEFEDVITIEVPRRRAVWCSGPSSDELAEMDPLEKRIAELETRLCEREAVITELQERLSGA
jgi:hypothetical protein